MKLLFKLALKNMKLNKALQLATVGLTASIITELYQDMTKKNSKNELKAYPNLETYSQTCLVLLQLKDVLDTFDNKYERHWKNLCHAIDTLCWMENLYEKKQASAAVNIHAEWLRVQTLDVIESFRQNNFVIPSIKKQVSEHATQLKEDVNMIYKNISLNHQEMMCTLLE